MLVGNDNDKNAGCFGGSGVEGVFRRRWPVVMVALNNGEAAIIGDSVGADL